MTSHMIPEVIIETETSLISTIINEKVSSAYITTVKFEENSQKIMQHKKKQELNADEKFLFLYDEYEIEEESGGFGVNTESEPFHKRVQILEEILSEKWKEAKKNKMDKKGKKDANDGLPIDNETRQMIEDLRNEVEVEAFNIEKKIALEKNQRIIRNPQLEKTLCVMSVRKKSYTEYEFNCWNHKEWLYYISCNGLPDATSIKELNRFLYIRKLEDYKITMNILSQQCAFIIILIKALNEIIDYSLKFLPSCIENYKEVRQKYRDSLQIWLDIASFNLLRQLDRETERVNLGTARYVKEITCLICSFWALIKQPISIKQITDKDKKLVEVDFVEINLTIKMPVNVDCYASALRALWIDFDYYSDRTKTFIMPELPEKYVSNMDLLDFCNIEHNWLNKLRDDEMDTREKRLQEKRAMIENLLKPPVDNSKDKKKKDKKNDQKKKLTTEPDSTVSNPEEIILQHEGC